MGLKDLVPEDKRDTRSRSAKKSLSERDDVVVFGSGEFQKSFGKDRWEDIREVMINEMGLVPNQVVNNYPAEERFEVLHEAAMLEAQEITLEELEREPNPCAICGTELGDEAGLDIMGVEVCYHHTVGQLSVVLDEE